MKSFLIVLIFYAVLFTDCKKPFYCGEVRGLEASILSINLFDTSTKEYFYQELGASLFNKDSLQVFNEDGRKFERISFGLVLDPRNNLRRFYGVGVAPAFIIPEDNDAYGREKMRKIFLKYNSNTTDTLTLVFKAYKDKCDKGFYEYLKIFYRGSLISSESSGISTVFQLNH